MWARGWQEQSVRVSGVNVGPCGVSNNCWCIYARVNELGGGSDGQKWMINRNFVVNSVIDDDVWL